MTTFSRMSAFLMVMLAACTWPLLTVVFVAPAVAAGIVLLALALGLSILAGSRQALPEPFELRYLIALPLLGLAGWLVPWPLSLGPLVLGVVLLAAAIFRSTPVIKNVLLGGVVLAIALVVQGLTLAPALDVMSRWHVVSYLAWPVAAALKYLGVHAAAALDSVTIATVRDSYRFPVSPELLAFPVAALALVGGWVVVLCLGSSRGRLRDAALLLGVWVLYLPLRAIMMLLLFVQLQVHVGYYAETVRADVLWNPWWQLGSFVPLAVVWGLTCRRTGDAREQASVLSRYRPARHTLVLAGALVGAGLLLFAVCHHEVGTPATRRVIFQERNSDWEKTTRSPGTRWYGTLSMYNMFSLADYLSYHYEVLRNDEPLSEGLLREGDVLVLKTPTAAYSPEEVDAVVDFVRRGGGVFMVGEHTNYVGTTYYLNAVAQRMGLRYRYDCLFNLAGDKGPYVQVWRRPGLYHHPITEHVGLLRFEVSCSVTGGSPAADAVMLSTGLFQLDADYYMENYYPYPRTSTNMHFGPFMQFVARDFGKGRVAAYTDSTNLSNFGAFYPGRAEFVLATVDWLGRKHSSGRWRWIAGALGVLALAAAFGLSVRLPDRVGTAVLLAAGVVFGCAAALALTRTCVRRDATLPAPRIKPVHVAFLTAHSGVEFPIVNFVEDHDWSYDLFFQWVLRLRYFPRLRTTLTDALKDDLIVIVNPVEPFAEAETRQLHQYLESGGRALVLLRKSSNPEAVGSLLDLFQIRADPALICTGQQLITAAGVPTGVVTDGMVVDGGKMLYHMGGRTVAVTQEIGRGKLVVAGFGDTFSNTGMGYTTTTLPDAQLRARFKLEFNLLQSLLPPEVSLPKQIAADVMEDSSWTR